jgi:hypothetical protein
MKEEDKDLVDLIVRMYIAEAAHNLKQAEYMQLFYMEMS